VVLILYTLADSHFVEGLKKLLLQFLFFKEDETALSTIAAVSLII
jgi:hypothetical protein